MSAPASQRATALRDGDPVSMNFPITKHAPGELPPREDRLRVSAMRQGTARRTQTSWMDRERGLEAWLNPDQLRVEADPYSFLAAARRENLERIVAQARARGRMPRVCLYALAFGGHEPRHSFDAATACAVRQCWQVGAGQSYADHHGAGAPETRPGWCGVRRQILAGYADGVVVVTVDVISPHVDEYRQELDWFEHKGFVAIVVPEARQGQA